MFSLLRQNCLIKKTINHQMVRTFLTNQQIGLDRFLKGKELNQHLDKEILVNNIKKSLEENDFVYTNDIKSLAYAIDTPEDAKLLKEAFIKFASKGEPIRLTDFKIGPVISRALYNIDDLETLEELVNNEKTKEHFELRTSVTVYLSFLYKKEKYDSILSYAEKIFAKVLEKDVANTISPEIANALTIYLAAANKVSSKETLDRARKLLHKYKEKLNETQRSDRDKPQLRLKHIMLYHLLCIKNNEFAEALEILSGFEKLEHYEFLNARAAILVRLGRTDECLVVIDKIINGDKEDGKPRYVFTETIDLIKQYLEKYPHDGLKSKIDSLNQEIILDAKIEDTILALPNAKSASERRNHQMNNQNRFNQNRFNQNRQQFSSDFNNRFTNRNQGGGMRFNDGQRNFQRQDNFNRFNDNNNFNRNRGNRFNDNFGDDQPRRNFRPFQTRFKEENSDLI